jgi:hypothetical protein
MITRQAMASLIELLPSYHLDKNKEAEEITFANEFDNIGYGFVGVRVKRSTKYRILINTLYPTSTFQVDSQPIKKQRI